MLWTLFGAVVVVSHCIVVVNIKVSSDSNLSKKCKRAIAKRFAKGQNVDKESTDEVQFVWQ